MSSPWWRRRTNLGIANQLHLSERTAETHVAGIFDKLVLGSSDGEEHRRVLAVVTFLRQQPAH